MKLHAVITALLLSATFSVSADDLSVNVTDFAGKGLAEWEEKSFSGYTQYRIKKDDGKTVLQATSKASASGIALKSEIDLLQTPYINWSWYSADRLSGLDETSKSGDDYVARIYLVIDGGWRPWKTLALNYVWSSNQAGGAEWDNAFAGDNAKMVAVRGNESAVGNWYQEKRNVYQDLIRAFGDKGSAEKNQKAYRYIDAIAIMTDTDNSGQQASALYWDIVFSAQ